MVDFRIYNQGSVVGFKPLTSDAKTWVDTNVSVEGWQYMGSVFYVDHRPAKFLLEAILSEGFTVVESAR